MSATTRSARETDVDAVRVLAAAAYEPYTERIGRPPAPVGADYVDLIARGTTWVAEHDGRIVGFVVLIRRPDHLLLDNVAVAPDAQGLGIGAQLSAEAWVCRTHLSHPALQTPRSVPAAGMAGHRESVNIVDR
jgi:GNAT superfamily N-acetyltransferase